MAEEEIGIRVTLRDRRTASQGLAEAKKDIEGLGDAAESASKKAESSTGRWGKLRSGMGKVGGLLGGMVKGGLLGAAAAGVGLIGTAIGKGFQRLNGIDQAKAKLTGLGHSASSVQSIMDNSLAAVQGTAFGLDEAAGTAAGAVAAGVKPGKDLERTLTLVADAATIGGTSMGEMGSIFNKVASSGKVQGDVLAQLGDRGIPIVELLAKELGVSAGEVTKLASEGKIGFGEFQAAMESGMGGAAQESGKTFSGSLKNAQAALGRLGAAFLGPVFEKMPALLQGATEKLDGLGPVAERVGQWVGSAFERIGPIVSQVGQWFSSLAGTASSRLMPIIRDVAAFFTGSVVPVFRDVAAFIRDQVVPAVVDIATKVGSNLKPIFDQLVATFRTHLLPTLTRLWSIFRTQILPALQPIIMRVLAFVGVVFKLASAVLGRVIPPLIRFAGLIISKVVPVVAKIIAFVLRFVGAALKFGGSLVGAIKTVGRFGASLVKLVSGGLTSVVRAVTGLPGRIMALGGRFLNAGKNVIGKFVDGLKGAGRLVSDIAGNVWNAVKGMLNGAITKINNALEFTIKIPGHDITIDPPDIPHLATGGPVTAGMPYVVGDGGRPELFVPETNGYVLPRVPRQLPDPSGWSLDGTDVTVGPNGPGGPVVIQLHMDGGKVAEVVLDAWDDAEARL